MMRTRDALDLKLLDLLQADTLRTADDLARDVALSPSAIARRVRRLRDTGVIAADVAVVSPGVGPFLSAVVEVQLDRHALAEVEAFLRRLAQHPSIQIVMEVSGAFDLMLLVTVTHMDAFNAFADEMLASDRVVRRYETRFVKKRRKFTTALPLDQLSE